MYRVVLIDDESIIVEGLRRVVKWADYGCEVVSTAGDAAEGAELIRELRNRGSNSLALEVRVSNEPAKALYESLGFHQVGLRKNYYRNPKEDALILRKEWGV